MFKKEVERIKEKYTNSLELLEKLETIYKPYDYSGEKRKDIFYLDIRISESPEHIKQHAFCALNDLINYNGLNSVKGNFGSYNDKRTLEEACKTVEEITLQTLFDSVCYYQPYYKANANREAEKIKIDDIKMLFEEGRAFEKDLYLVLNCIYFLSGNNELMTPELKNKIYQKAKNGETFIFCGCKVTLYKNGKLNIFFSDSNLFNTFKNHIEIGLNNAQLEYNKKERA